MFGARGSAWIGRTITLLADAPDFKLDCFDSVAKEDSADCKKFVRDINHRALTPVLGN